MICPTFLHLSRLDRHSPRQELYDLNVTPDLCFEQSGSQDITVSDWAAALSVSSSHAQEGTRYILKFLLFVNQDIYFLYIIPAVGCLFGVMCDLNYS